jgi:trypsin
MKHLSSNLLRAAMVMLGIACVPSAVAANLTVDELNLADEAVEAFKQTAKTKTWMWEYVQLRRMAMTHRAIGPGLPSSVGYRSAKIVGGEDAKPEDNPFQVALLFGAQPNNAQAQFCGGTMVSPTSIVTAAHCSDFVATKDVAVLVGARRLDGSGTRYSVASITIHPKWDSQTFDYDVAVWRLEKSAGDVPVAKLASKESADLLATGWGALKENGPAPIDLQKVSVPLVTYDDCNDENSYDGNVSARMICAGKPGKDTCQGDSGGPLTGGPGNGELTGITSWGIGCARPNYFGVYTRVADPDVRQFLQDHL